ncbi:MAG: hypothetical protein LBG87_01135 [Spirochaetaceae bacterium]|jgi:hypothetical protein|nr:hypothetical protein [Spirochaetaceae bacterium]
MEQIKGSVRFWRAVAGAVLILWLLVSAVNLFDLDPEKVPQMEQDSMTLSRFLIASLCTTLALGFLLIVPRQFYIYTGVFCFWGLSALVDGGKGTALLMYLLGLGFAYKQGFFKTFRRVKVLASILLVIGAVSLQYRYGASAILNTVLTWIALCMIGGLGYQLFLPELRKFFARVGEAEVPQCPSSADTALGELNFDDIDRTIAERISQGEKYERIAIDLNVSVPTVKRRAKRIFEEAGVADRREFLNRYSGILPDFV